MEKQTHQLYNYHIWANQRVFEHVNVLPDEVYHQEIKSVFSSIQEVLIHIYQTDGLWLSVMSGDDFSQTMEVIQQLKEKSSNNTFSEMQQTYKEMHERYIDFLDCHDDLHRNLTISHPKYGDFNATVADMVKHVVNHGTYHRGNITAMLRQQGHSGVPTDYIFYLYENS